MGICRDSNIYVGEKEQQRLTDLGGVGGGEEDEEEDTADMRKGVPILLSHRPTFFSFSSFFYKKIFS